jgi:hypothetical protein
MEITMAESQMPTLPFANATEAERAAWREEMHRWLDKHRGADLGAKGLEQEQRIIDFLSRSPADQERITPSGCATASAGTTSSGMKTATSCDQWGGGNPGHAGEF